jgi:hypothetical protein
VGCWNVQQREGAELLVGSVMKKLLLPWGGGLRLGENIEMILRRAA